MRLLLDTHAFLWFIEGDSRLNVMMRTLIAEPANPVYISTASLWEMSIKISTGKLGLSQPFQILIPQQTTLNDITLLHIEIAHLNTVITLPSHHRDPFDRLIIAQAMVEGLPIASADKAFDLYAVTRLW
jgi:PIN domain nuclease of toxin-antitoxin system